MREESKVERRRGKVRIDLVRGRGRRGRNRFEPSCRVPSRRNNVCVISVRSVVALDVPSRRTSSARMPFSPLDQRYASQLRPVIWKSLSVPPTLMYSGASVILMNVGRCFVTLVLLCGRRAEPVRSRKESMASLAMARIVSWSSQVVSAYARPFHLQRYSTVGRDEVSARAR